LDNIVFPDSTTAQAVSSHVVSIPKTSIFFSKFFGKDYSKSRKNSEEKQI
jgi:hypothetical protein